VHAILAEDPLHLALHGFDCVTGAEWVDASICIARPLPTDAEQVLIEALGRVTEPGALESARSIVNLRLAAKLRNFSVRCVSLAVRQCDPALLRIGVFALLLDDDLQDDRDILTRAGVHWDAGERLGSDIGKLLTQWAQFGTVRRRDLLVNVFVAGPSYMHSAESMGFRAVNDNDGTTYRAVPLW
jgi:hypothetical protein